MWSNMKYNHLIIFSVIMYFYTLKNGSCIVPYTTDFRTHVSTLHFKINFAFPHTFTVDDGSSHLQGNTKKYQEAGNLWYPCSHNWRLNPRNKRIDNQSCHPWLCISDQACTTVTASKQLHWFRMLWPYDFTLANIVWKDQESWEEEFELLTTYL